MRAPSRNGLPGEEEEVVVADEEEEKEEEEERVESLNVSSTLFVRV